VGAGGAGSLAGGGGPESPPLWRPPTASTAPSTRKGGIAPGRRTTRPPAPPTGRQHTTAHHSRAVTCPLTPRNNFWHPTGGSRRTRRRSGPWSRRWRRRSGPGATGRTPPRSGTPGRRSHRGAWLDVAPAALEHVLAGIDKLACPCDCLLVDRVGSHSRIRAMPARGGAVQHATAIYQAATPDVALPRSVYARLLPKVSPSSRVPATPPLPWKNCWAPVVVRAPAEP
jgi:hypothetical protein